MFSPGISLAALLIALGVGYIIRLKAEEAKAGLKTLGIVIAYIIIIVSILATACQLYFTHCKFLRYKALSCPLPHMMQEGPMGR